MSAFIDFKHLKKKKGPLDHPKFSLVQILRKLEKHDFTQKYFVLKRLWVLPNITDQ